MRKPVTFIVAVALCTASVTSTPRKAEAALGILGIGTPAGIPLVVAGGIATFGALWYDLFLLQWCGSRCGPKEILIGVGWTLAGMAVLDAQEGPVLKFAPVGDEEASTIGLSAEETRSFNQELEEINAVSESVAASLAKLEKPTLDDSRALWRTYGGSLSPAATHAANKVSTHWLNRLAAERRGS